MTDRPRPEASWEKRADELFAKVGAPAPLSTAAVQRIFAELDRPALRGFRWRSAWAGAGAAFLAVNAAWAAVLVYQHHRRAVELAQQAVPATNPLKPPAPSLVPPPVETAPAAPAAAPAIAKGPPRLPHLANPSRPQAPTVAPTVTQAAAPPSSTLVAESSALAGAVRALRQQRDATAALGLLETYERDFPRGVLRPDAELLRVETLVALGRRAEAVLLLDRLGAESRSNGGVPPAAEIERLRGEIDANDGSPSEEE